MTEDIALDFYCGLGGWAEGLLSEGFTCIGFDVERHDYGTGGYPGQLILQDVLTICGAQFRSIVDRIRVLVASPPCTEYSYMAMPWKRARQIARALRDEDKFPADYKGSRSIEQLNALFFACFRIQRELSEVAGRHIPLIVENVKGAQPWVGMAKANFGSYYLWGDVGRIGNRVVPLNGKLGQDVGVRPHSRMAKVPGLNWTLGSPTYTRKAFNDTAVKQSGIGGSRKNGKGDAWFQDGAATFASHSEKRKQASAMIAKIPFPLASHIARCFSTRTLAG